MILCLSQPVTFAHNLTHPPSQTAKARLGRKETSAAVTTPLLETFNLDKIAKKLP